MTYTRGFTAALLFAIFVVAGLAALAPAAEAANPCVGADVTVTVLGQPYPVLTNGCSWCFISQGPNWAGIAENRPNETSTQNFFCLDPP